MSSMIDPINPMLDPAMATDGYLFQLKNERLSRPTLKYNYNFEMLRIEGDDFHNGNDEFVFLNDKRVPVDTFMTILENPDAMKYIESDAIIKDLQRYNTQAKTEKDKAVKEKEEAEKTLEEYQKVMKKITNETDFETVKKMVNGYTMYKDLQYETTKELSVITLFVEKHLININSALAHIQSYVKEDHFVFYKKEDGWKKNRLSLWTENLDGEEYCINLWLNLAEDDRQNIQKVTILFGLDFHKKKRFTNLKNNWKIKKNKKDLENYLKYSSEKDYYESLIK